MKKLIYLILKIKIRIVMILLATTKNRKMIVINLKIVFQVTKGQQSRIIIPNLSPTELRGSRNPRRKDICKFMIWKTAEMYLN